MKSFLALIAVLLSTCCASAQEPMRSSTSPAVMSSLFESATEWSNPDRLLLASDLTSDRVQNLAYVYVPFFSYATAPVPVVTSKTIDKRTQSDADGSKYFVVINARAGSKTGHAFVTWGVEDSQRRMSLGESYGFYPANGTGAFGSVPGYIRNEAMNPNTTLITDRLTVRVNKSVYLNSQSARTRWATTNYSLYSSNCINFAMDVGRKIGLTVPAKGITTQFPSNYVRDLIRSN